MKVAICLSGLIGNSRKFGKGHLIDYRKTKFYLERSFNNQKIEFYYFLHCWNINLEKELVRFYKPAKFSFEESIKNNKNLDIKQYGYVSSNYSKKKVIELKKKYEKENKITFDLVVLTRFDILIYPKLNLHNLDEKKFYIAGPKKHHKLNCKCLFCDDTNENHHVNDCIFIGNSKNMDKFSLAYNYLDEYGLKSNHIITKLHLVKVDLWSNVDYLFKWPTNKYPDIWRLLEYLHLFPKDMVPARIYDIDIPLTRWVDKSLYLKSLDFIIFKLRLDVIYYYLIIKPQRVLSLFIKK